VGVKEEEGEKRKRGKASSSSRGKKRFFKQREIFLRGLYEKEMEKWGGNKRTFLISLFQKKGGDEK